MLQNIIRVKLLTYLCMLFIVLLIFFRGNVTFEVPYFIMYDSPGSVVAEHQTVGSDFTGHHNVCDAGRRSHQAMDIGELMSE